MRDYYHAVAPTFEYLYNYMSYEVFIHIFSLLLIQMSVSELGGIMHYNNQPTQDGFSESVH